MIGIPTTEDVRAWVAVPATAISDDDLAQIRAAELAIITETCRLPDDPDPDTGAEATFPPPLARSLLRRCQRQIAAKAIPLGSIGSDASEYAPISLPRWDAIVSQLEAPYRIPVVS